MTSIALDPTTERLDDPVVDAREVDRILAEGRLAYVSIGTTRGPLVTPVLYGTAGGALWVLTNRHALKAKVWRRRPRAGWTVRTADAAVVMTGEAILLSPLDAKALLARPLGLVAVPPAVLSWARRNPRQVGGFVWDALAHPTRGMPQDFVLVRLQPDSVTVVHDLDAPTESGAAADPRIGAVLPNDLARLTTLSAGVLGLVGADGPVAVPAAWDHARSVARVPQAVAHLAADVAEEACLTFDEPVRLRPTEQRGVVLRGPASPVPGDEAALALAPTRVTSWDGFDVKTVEVSPG